MKEGTSMELHLKHMKEITDKLAAIGAPISEEDQVVTLLGSVPPIYSALVTTLESRIDSVKLSYVQQALLHEERKQQEKLGSLNGAQSISQSDSALVGTLEKTQRTVRCFGCGELGHIHHFGHVRKNFDNAGLPHKAKTAEVNVSNSDGAFAVSMTSLQRSQSNQ